jgi:hypothetical protein
MSFRQLLAERSYREDDIPDYFYVVMRFDTPTQDDLAAGRPIVGVKGISGSWRIVTQFLGIRERNLVIVMPGHPTARINKLSRVMYANPHYLAQDDMSAAKRLSGLEHSRPGYWVAKALEGRLQQIIRKSGYSAFAVNVIEGLRFDDVGYWQKQGRIRNLKHLVNAWQGYMRALVAPREFARINDDQRTVAKANYATWLRWVSQALMVRYKDSFEDEEEWRVKDATLRLPKRTKLVVMARGPAEAEVEWLKSASDRWNDSNVLHSWDYITALAYVRQKV